jgi:hypothetical protein
VKGCILDTLHSPTPKRHLFPGLSLSEKYCSCLGLSLIRLVMEAQQPDANDGDMNSSA